MATKPERGLGIRTSRDEQRRLDRLAAQELWAKVDAEIADALGENEWLDDITTPRAVP